MQSVGQQIRETRLTLGLTLEGISAKSRIPVKKLQAIEDDDLTSIGSPFFYRSFVRQFSECVHLDYATLLPRVESATASMPQPRIPGQGEFGKATRIEPMPIRKESRNFRWLSSIASLGVMLIACSSLYALWQNSKSVRLTSLADLLHAGKPAVADQSATASVPAAPPEPIHPQRLSPVHHSAEQASLSSSTSSAPSVDTSADNDPNRLASGDHANSDFRIELSAIERTWLLIVEDGKETFQGTLDPAETKVLEGHDTARIRTGNAGGINCIFNGKSIGPLGPRGQVRTVVFTKSNYEVLDAPAYVALTSFVPTGG